MYREEVLNAKKKFEEFMSAIVLEKDLQQKANIAKQAIDFALRDSTCYYSAPVIEQVFLDMAQTISLEATPEYCPNSCLHIMTACWKTGGHTRVVERWIELMPNGQKHSLLFTSLENQPVPKRLVDAVRDKGGEIFFLEDKLTDIEKGLKLRAIASAYEHVTLHIHMHDYIPIIAFGTVEFTRPIVLFNHADHLFWIGVSIADVVADLRTFGQKISAANRGVKNTHILSIPIDNSKNIHKIKKTHARSELNIPQDAKVVLTIGSAHKYLPMGNIDFLDTIKDILKNDSNIIIMAIGPEFDTLPQWKKVSEHFNDRIIALGQISHDKLYKYIFAADVMLDSRPMSGGVALTDGVVCGCPVLSLENPCGQFDWVKCSSAFCNSDEEMVTRTLSIVHDDALQRQYSQEQLEVLEKLNSIDAWLDNMQKVFNALPDKHRIYDFVTTPSPLTELDVYHFYNNHHVYKKIIIDIQGFLSIYKVKTKNKSAKILTVSIFSYEMNYIYKE